MKKATVTRRYFIHLSSLSSSLLNIARQTHPTEQFKFVLGSMTFSAFALEALANISGEQLIPQWKHFESAKPIAKIILISTTLNQDVDFSREPFQTISEIFKFRNTIVHSKQFHYSKDLTEEENNLYESFDKDFGFKLSPNIITSFSNEFIQKLEIDNAERFLECIDSIATEWLFLGQRKDSKFNIYDTYSIVSE